MTNLLHYSTSCLDVRTVRLSVCLSVSSKKNDCRVSPSLLLLTCGGFWGDGGPGQSGSGEQDVMTLFPQFEDPTQHNTLTDTHKQSLFLTNRFKV